MLLVASILTAIILVLLIDFLAKRRRNENFRKSKITGPRALPLLGCGLELISLGPEAIIPYFGRLFEKYGQTFRLWMLHEAHVYTTDLRIFERILTSSTALRKGDLYDFLRSWLNDGLLLSVLDHFVGIFDKQSQIMAEILAPYADGQQINIFDFVGPAALDSITEAAMGVKVNAQLRPGFPYVQALKRVTYIQSDRLFKINQRYDFTFMLTAPSLYRELKQGFKTMHDFTNRVIEDRRAFLQKSIADGSYRPISIADDEIGSKDQMTFLDVLLQSSVQGRPLTNREICEEVDTFTFEGDDTTTSGISHALYCISRHSEVQRKIFDEIVAIVGVDKNESITIGQLQEMKYLDCVLKEVLRLYPAVPAIGRRIETDIVIDGVTLPANTNVYLVMYFAHRNPKYFTDPEIFRPERFLHEAEDELMQHPFAYTPFSAGPKNCIGQRFAMLEMKAIVSKVLRYYELLPVGPGIAPMMNFILRSPQGMNLGLTKRRY